MISIQKTAVLFEECTRNTMFHSLWLCCCLYPPYRWGHWKCSFTFLFVHTSTLKESNVDKHGTCSTHHEEYCDNFLQKYQSLMQFCPQISFPHFLQSHTLVQHLLHLLTLMGNHYTDHCQHFHVHHRSVYASHKSQVFSFLCHNTLATTWLVSPLVISAVKHKIWYSYVVQLQAFSTAMRPHTH